MRHLSSLLFVAIACAFQAPPPETGTIEGRVVDSVTGEAIRKATVTLMPRPAANRAQSANRAVGAGMMPPQESGFITDANGVFRATVAPGTYYPRAERNGYVAVTERTEEVAVGKGETAKGVTIKLNQHGVISGRVLDEDGEPMARINVLCLKWMQANGQRMLSPLGNSLTNDLGEYRLFGLTPGRCIVSAQPVTYAMPRARTRQTYTTIYFPGVTEMSAAQPIDVTPGSTRQGVDLPLRKVSVVSVSGKIGGLPSVGEGDRRVPGRMMNVMAQLVPRSAGARMGMMQHSAPVNAQGDFDFQSVPSGSYILIANAFNNQDRRSGRLNLEVGEREVTGLSLNLEPAITLSAQVTAEDAPNLTTINVTMISATSPMFGGTVGRTDAQGRMVFMNLEKDVYRMQVNGLPAGYYIKSAQLGSIDAKEAVDLSAGAADVLAIALEKGTAELTGQVKAQDRPAVNAQVLVLNARNETVRSAFTDALGHYSVTELAPGDYRVLALSSQELNDPDTVDRLAPNAVKVTLARSARESRDLEVR